MDKKSAAPAKAAGKDGRKVPPGGGMAPGTPAYRATQKAPRPAPVTIDKSFVKDPRGGKPLVAGPRHIEVKGDRTRDTR